MGIEGLATMNSGTVLETRRIERGWRLSLVTTKVPAELVVSIFTEPKLNETGDTPTLASAGTGYSTEPTRNKTRDGHTRSVLPMDGNPCRIFWSEMRAG